MTDLSPAASAVMKALLEAKFECKIELNDYPRMTRILGRELAAALRAAADQVAPWRPEPTEESVGPTIDYGYAWALFSSANDIRQELIAIADELERAR